MTHSEFLQLPLISWLDCQKVNPIHSNRLHHFCHMTLSLKQKLHHLLDVWMLTEGYDYPLDTQPRFGSFPSQKPASLTLCLDANASILFEPSTEFLPLLPSQNLHHLLDVWMLTQGLLSFGHLTEVLALLPSQKPYLLLDVWMLTQECFLWALNRGSDPITAALYFLVFKILMLVSYLIEYFRQCVKLPVYFFREPCRLLLYLFFEVVINLSFVLPQCWDTPSAP